MATFPTYNKPVLIRPTRESTKIESYVCEEDVKQGQVLKPGGTNADEVEPSDTTGEDVNGVALTDGSAGDVIDVVEKGMVRLQSADGNISAGDRIASGGGTTEGSVIAESSGDIVFGQARFDDGGTAGGSTLGNVECMVDFTSTDTSHG